jgi:hypothetical protein
MSYCNKGTLGITALLLWIVQIGKVVCDLDVELMNLFYEEVKKGRLLIF